MPTSVGYPDGNVEPEGTSPVPRWPPSSVSSPTRAGTSSGARPTPTDVSEDWYNNAVSTLTNAASDGYEDGTFKPNGNITRAELPPSPCASSEATYEGENLFPDIDGHWVPGLHQRGRQRRHRGWVSSDGTFGPQSSSPRPRP